MMTISDVIAVVSALKADTIDVQVDGGWGVDALFGEQTRPHDDLDLVLALGDADRAMKALARLGFRLHGDYRPIRFVVRDGTGRSVDAHTVTREAGGAAIQVQPDGTTFRYPQQGVAGAGTIGPLSVDCVSPETQVLAHLGYEPSETDRSDMEALHVRFGVPLPSPYGAQRLL
jgi:lincosamide nucleotidyltransferase A/C/D/E